jgi:hypothetical protein
LRKYVILNCRLINEYVIEKRAKWRQSWPNYRQYTVVCYADDVNILEGSVHAVKKNTEALVAATKETGLEVNADKIKYMVTSRDQNAGRNHSVKIDNISFERVEEFRYLGKTLTNQNSIQEEVKSLLKSGNACY